MRERRERGGKAGKAKMEGKGKGGALTHVVVIIPTATERDLIDVVS